MTITEQTLDEGNPSPPQKNCITDISSILEHALKAAERDSGAMFGPQVIDAFKHLKQNNRPDFERQRSKFKAIKGIRIGALDELLTDELIGEMEEIDYVKEISQHAEFFHDADNNAYASIKHDDHIEVHKLDSKDFKLWVGFIIYSKSSLTISESKMDSLLLDLCGMAIYRGEEHEVHLRCAQHEDGYLIDLCDAQWRVIYVMPGKWEVLDMSPVKFYRNTSMRPLPVPEQGKGQLNLIKNNVNVSDEQLPLLLTFILESYRPNTPFVILEISGQHGSAKSDTQEAIRNLIDPNQVNLRAAPKSTEDIYVSAGRNWMFSYNNLSSLNAAMQDALCTVATGGGFASRTLYTNTEETIINVHRPGMMNGIGTIATAQDLIDREILIIPPIIKAVNRKPKEEVSAQFKRDAPLIMAGILDLFDETLQRLPEVELTEKPRMADFAKLGEAMTQTKTYQALNLPENDFMKLYMANRSFLSSQALEAQPVVVALIEFMHKEKNYKGNFKKLLTKLLAYKPNRACWPDTPKGLSEVIKRQIQALKQVDIHVKFDSVRKSDGFHLQISYLGKS